MTVATAGSSSATSRYLRITSPTGLVFKYADKIVAFARRHRMLVFGAHLVWDEGFGEGWTDDVEDGRADTA